MPWAAFMLWFFGSFGSGELTVLHNKSFDPEVHVSWRDLHVALSNLRNPWAIKLQLRLSKHTSSVMEWS